MSESIHTFPMTLSGKILLSTPEFDWDVMRVQFFDDWQVEIENEPTEDNLIVPFGDGTVTVTLSLIRKTVPEAYETADYNIFWPNATEEVARHQAYVVIGVIGAANPLQRHVLFTMFAATALKQPNAIGVYQFPVARKASDYMEGALALKQDNIPLTNWVFVGFHESDAGKLCCYTYGLTQFERNEIEIIDSNASIEQMFSFIYQVIEYIVSQGGTLNDGESIGFTEDNAYLCTLSEGVVLDGDTVKIAF